MPYGQKQGLRFDQALLAGGELSSDMTTANGLLSSRRIYRDRLAIDFCNFYARNGGESGSASLYVDAVAVYSAMRHRWSFDILMCTQSKHKEEERRPEAARPRRARARQWQWRPWPQPRLWGPHLGSNNVTARLRTWRGPWRCCWCGGLERGVAAATRRLSAWCSQRSPMHELGMGVDEGG